jgi:hypothetical protein
MIDFKILHSVLIEMHGGMLTLATVCLLATIISKFHLHMRRTSKKYGFLWPLDSILKKLAEYGEPTAYIAGIGGVIGLIAAAIVGSGAWPAEALMTSSLGLNKIMLTIFATDLWIMFVLIRSKYGRKLWDKRGLALVYSCTGLAGFLFMVTTGCFGGHMTYGVSLLDPVWDLLQVNVNSYWIAGFNQMPILVSAAIIEILAVFAIFLYSRKK